MKNILKKEWLLWLFLALPFIYTAIIWNSLPDKVPTHWDMNNHVNGYSSKAFAGFFAPCFNVGLYLFFCGLFWALPRIDPRKASYENMGDTLYKIRAGVTIFMTLMFLFIMNSMLTQNPVIATKAIAVLMMLLFIVLGNYMRTLRPNYFVGIRTPWTIDNPEVWIRTHDVGGKIIFYTGIFGALIVLAIDFVSSNDLFPIGTAIALLIGAAIYIIYYSYKLFNRLEKETGRNPNDTMRV